MGGVYFYVVSYAPLYQDKDVLDDFNSAQGADFTIFGGMYGGMMASDTYEHPSFVLETGGKYEYFKGGTGDDEQQNGTLPDVLSTELMEALDSADLEGYAAPAPEDKSCVSYVDGVENEYSIEIDGDIYDVDTCTTGFENKSELGRVLLKIWKYMESPDERRISISNTPTDDDEVDEEGKLVETRKKPFWSLSGYFEQGFEDAGFE